MDLQRSTGELGQEGDADAVRDRTAATRHGQTSRGGDDSVCVGGGLKEKDSQYSQAEVYA